MKKLISVLMILFIVCLNVYCEELPEISVSYERATGKVDVSGNIGKDVSKVTLMVLRPDASVLDMDKDTGNFFVSAIHADEKAVTEGAYTFDSFNISSYAPGVYTIMVSDGKNIYDKKINAATEAQAVDLIKNATDSAAVLKYIGLYNDIYGLDTAHDSLFDKIGSAGQKETALRIANANPASVSEIKELFDRNNIFYKIYLGPWTALEKLLSDNSTLLGIDISLLSSAYSASDVYKALAGKLFLDKSDFNSAYVAAVSASKPPYTVVVGGGSSSGGSSSSGGGSAYMPTTIPPSENNKEESADSKKESSFNDVDKNHWAFESVEKLYKNSIINGKSEKTFAPDDKVTRAEAVKMIVLAFDIQNVGAGVSFGDVSAKDWSYNYISAAASNKIVNGYSDKIFGKNDYVTKQDLAVMIYRAAKASGALPSTLNDMEFSDYENISQYAKEAVEALADAGIINGYNGMFMPSSNATRAETAKILAAFVN